MADTSMLLQTRSLSKRLTHYGESALILIAIGFVLEFTVLALLRIPYPYELEWTESASIDEIRWILNGQRLYGEPNIAFLPLTYTPVYFYLSAGLAKLIGFSPLAPRLLSVIATLGTLGTLYTIVTKESKRPAAGLLAAGIYAASFRFTGAWMDLAKTDSLFLLFVLAAFWIGYRAVKPSGYILSGFFFTIAYFTKQLALPILLVLAPLSWVLMRGKNWLQWISVLAFSLAIYLILQVTSNGWFSFYTFEILQYHGRIFNLSPFWVSLLGKMWPSALLVLLFVVVSLRQLRGRVEQRPSMPWLFVSFGMALVLASWSISFKAWTYDNAFMPACLGFALLAGLGYSKISIINEVSFGSSSMAHLTWLGGAVVILAQFATLLYHPTHQLPSMENRRQAGEFTQFVADLPGEVWVFSHTYFSHLAGKTTYFHSAPFGDLVGGSPPPVTSNTYLRREAAVQVFTQALAEQDFDWIIIDKPADFWLPYYITVQELDFDFYPVTGAPARPEILLAPNPIVRGGNLPLDDSLYSSLFAEGWSSPQESGRRSEGSRSIIRLALQPELSYEVTIQARPSCLNNHPIPFKFNTKWNNESLGQVEFSDCRVHTFIFRLPGDNITGRIDELRFEYNQEAFLAENTATGVEFQEILFIPKE